MIRLVHLFMLPLICAPVLARAAPYLNPSKAEIVSHTDPAAEVVNPVGDTTVIEPPVAPTPDAIEAYPDYDVSETIERKLKAAPRQVADIILDYTQQCRTCKYPVASVIAQEVYQRDIDPYRFLVWQDVNKQINILVKKIPFKSSSWTQVRVFANADQSSIIIDSKLLDEQRAAQAAKQYARPSDPAFAILHSRWVITALVPDQHRGHQTLIKGVAGGKGQGVATLVPKPFMRKELKAVMSETLDFVEP